MLAAVVMADVFAQDALGVAFATFLPAAPEKWVTAASGARAPLPRPIASQLTSIRRVDLRLRHLEQLPSLATQDSHLRAPSSHPPADAEARGLRKKAQRGDKTSPPSRGGTGGSLAHGTLSASFGPG
jgi:hypothetical protein